MGPLDSSPALAGIPERNAAIAPAKSFPSSGIRQIVDWSSRDGTRIPEVVPPPGAADPAGGAEVASWGAVPDTVPDPRPPQERLL